MKVLIVEDEIPAAEKLERYLHKYDPNITILKKLTNVADTSEWLADHQSEVDLMFFDIQLTDGLSFEVFNRVNVTKPVIFITAYDEYAVDAFKVNSIDYLLKPITFMDLSSSMKKMDSFKEQFSDVGEKVKSAFQNASDKKYKQRFLVKLGEHIHSIKTEDCYLFFAEGRTAYLITNEGKKFIIDFKLEELEEVLDPSQFLRVNRTYITNINAIKDVLVYSNSRLKITPKINFDKEIIVSREKVATFKEWFGGM